MILVITLALGGFALFAVGVAFGDWRRGRIDRSSPAVVREIREQADRILVGVFSAPVMRRQADEEQARRAMLYPADVSLPRDTQPALES